MIEKNAIVNSLDTMWVGRQIVCFEQTDSTNTQGKILVQNGAEHGTLIIADQQTAGKGRLGRTWVSPSGESIYMTLILKPDISVENVSMLTLVAAMAVVKAVEQLQITTDCMIKWPNDIVVNKKKVCGILTEMTTEQNQIQSVLIGIGINANTTEFAEEIREIATSFYKETGCQVNRETLIAEVMNQFEKYYDIFSRTQDMSALADDYNGKLVHFGQMVYLNDGNERKCVKALGIDERGALLVEDEQGSTQAVISGEISIRGIYGYV